MPRIGQALWHNGTVEKIGEGGMGKAFLVGDLTSDRKVALKFHTDAFTSDPERMARFEREAGCDIKTRTGLGSVTGRSSS